LTVTVGAALSPPRSCFEIDMLEPSLRKMHGSSKAWGASFRPRDAAIDSFVERVELFKPKTVNAVMLLRGWVQDLKGSMPVGPRDPKLDTAHRTWSMRTMAGLTVLAGLDARRALLDEGGEVHPIPHDRRFKEPELPKLPAPLEHLWDPPRLDEPETEPGEALTLSHACTTATPDAQGRGDA
jgi:hypothetical protein